MGTRRLILHFGFGKTGTSALQIALARNAAILEQHNIRYPIDASARAAQEGKITSGNGLGLAKFLCRDAPWPGEPKDALWEIARPDQPDGDLLFSSEKLAGFAPKRLQRLNSLAEACGYQIVMVGFVRHLIGHAFAMYVQSLRGRKFTGSFHEYLQSAYKAPFFTTLRFARDILGPEAVLVRLYENVEGDICRSLLSMLGHDDVATEPAPTRFNATGGRKSAQVLAACLSHMGSADDAWVFAKRYAAIEEEDHFYEDELDTLREAAEPHLGVINEFLRDEEVLFRSPGDIIRPGAEPPITNETKALIAAMVAFKSA
jgi:hypothetical protein